MLKKQDEVEEIEIDNDDYDKIEEDFIVDDDCEYEEDIEDSADVEVEEAASDWIED